MLSEGYSSAGVLRERQRFAVGEKPFALGLDHRSEMRARSLFRFPTAAHDDQVDVLSDLIAELTLGGGGTVGVLVVG